jgi:hypothetical protein
MTNKPKIEILPLIKQLETFRVDQEQKLELAQAIMLGAAMGLQQQYDKIGTLDRKLDRAKQKNEELARRLSKYETHDL